MTPLTAVTPALLNASALTRVEALPAEVSPLRMPGVEVLPAPDRIGGAIPGQAAGESFGSVLGRLVQDVNARQLAAGEAVRGLQAGDNVSLHQAVIAMEEANVSFQLMVEVRNKLLEAYQELMRMQI
jgi:flagellar hook-basal body complex protein FliE